MKKIGLAIVSIFLIYGLLQFLPPIQQETRSALSSNSFRIAHRCGKLLYPENTLYACKEVVRSGLADILEMDFHLTKDGVPVVIHDPTLDRTTNGSGKIADKTWDEIKDLDAAYHFSLDGGKSYPLRGKGIRLATLEEMIRELKDHKLMIEVKPNSEKAADVLLELVEKYSISDKVILGSFHQNIKDYMVEKNPQLAYLASKWDVTIWVILEKLNLSHLWNLEAQAMALPPQQSILTLTEKLIQKAHSQNVQIFVWTINEKEEMENWFKNGVDGIITDNPRTLTEVLKKTQNKESKK